MYKTVAVKVKSDKNQVAPMRLNVLPSFLVSGNSQQCNDSELCD